LCWSVNFGGSGSFPFVNAAARKRAFTTKETNNKELCVRPRRVATYTTMSTVANARKPNAMMYRFKRLPFWTESALFRIFGLSLENHLGQRVSRRMRDAERHTLHSELLRNFCRLARYCQGGTPARLPHYF
jgi:hypothetical protein